MTGLTLAVFVFFTIGVKVLLAVVVCYLLLTSERECTACAGETLALKPPAGAGWLLTGLRVERRWCTRCTRSAWARRGPGKPGLPSAPAPRRRQRIPRR